MAGSRGNGTAVLLPEPPIMILFTIHEGKYTFLHLECISVSHTSSVNLGLTPHSERLHLRQQ